MHSNNIKIALVALISVTPIKTAAKSIFRRVNKAMEEAKNIEKLNVDLLIQLEKVKSENTKKRSQQQKLQNNVNGYQLALQILSTIVKEIQLHE